MNITIRQEKPSDADAVYDLVKHAFEAMEFSDHDEQNLVNRLRRSSAFVPELTLVAEVDGQLAGHIMFTKIDVGGKTLLALAPLAVLTTLQKQGIGGQLIRAGHAAAKAMGYVGCVVLGHEKYYPRFGYTVASGFGISAPFDVPDESFMAIELIPGGLAETHGTVTYAKEFFEQ